MNSQIENRVNDIKHGMNVSEHKLMLLNEEEVLLTNCIEVTGAKFDWFSLWQSAVDKIWFASFEFTIENATQDQIDQCIYFLDEIGQAPEATMYGGYSYGYQLQNHNYIERRLPLREGMRDKVETYCIRIVFKFPKHQEKEYQVKIYARESFDKRYEVSCANGGR